MSKFPGGLAPYIDTFLFSIVAKVSTFIVLNSGYCVRAFACFCVLSLDSGHRHNFAALHRILKSSVRPNLFCAVRWLLYPCPTCLERCNS